MASPVPQPSYGAFAYTKASLEQQAIWSSIYSWMHGSECVTGQHPLVRSDSDVEQLAARVTALTTTEIVRVGSAYILGQAAALGHNAVAQTALSTLMQLLQHSRNVVARCAMYALTNAGARASDSLCTLLEGTTLRLLQVDPAKQPQSTLDGGEPSTMLDIIALVSHALGESTQHPTERVVKALTAALEVTLTHLEAQIQRVVDPQQLAEVAQTPIRTGINAGRSDGRGADRWLSLAVRAASAVMDALGLVAEWVVAVPPRHSIESQRRMVVRICDAVLPVSLRPDPALHVPGDVLSHDNSRFWLAEAAAYCVLRLVSSGAAQVQTTHLQVVALTCPAHHSDQRYAPALCLAAVDRLRQLLGGPNVVPIVVAELLPRLEEAEEGWAAMAVEASVDNPEPWLVAGEHGVEWQ